MNIISKGPAFVIGALAVLPFYAVAQSNTCWPTIVSLGAATNGTVTPIAGSTDFEYSFDNTMTITCSMGSINACKICTYLVYFYWDEIADEWIKEEGPFTNTFTYSCNTENISTFRNTHSPFAGHALDIYKAQFGVSPNPHGSPCPTDKDEVQILTTTYFSKSGLSSPPNP